MSLHLNELLAIYRRWPDERKQKAKAFFDDLDVDGDGTVSKPELRAKLFTDDGNPKAVMEFDKMWRVLDADGDGSLDYHECVALYLIATTGTNICDCASCHKIMIVDETMYCNRDSCKVFADAMTNGEEPDDSLWHSLCNECYKYEDPSSWVFKGADKSKSFWEAVNQREMPCQKWTFLTTRTDWARCDICNDVHTPDATSYLGVPDNNHMHRLPDGRMACEFCCYSKCSKCGDAMIFDTMPGVWRQQDYEYEHVDCIGKGEHYYEPEAIVAKAHGPHTTHCYTCQLKLVKRELPGLKEAEMPQEQGGEEETSEEDDCEEEDAEEEAAVQQPMATSRAIKQERSFMEKAGSFMGDMAVDAIVTVKEIAKVAAKKAVEEQAVEMVKEGLGVLFESAANECSIM